MSDTSFAPTPAEVALGTVFGASPDAEPLPAIDPGTSPRAALEQVVLGALTRPPCGVSFSGGRDSSLVLAVATHVARREGLPLPIPLTHVFPNVPESVEDEWQELVIRRLGLEEWTRLVWRGGEMDVLGELATTVLRRVGVLDPFNAFFHDPLCAEVRGGSLLTGVGGDEMLSGVMDRIAFRIRYRHKRPRPADLLPLARSYAPQSVRARALVRRRTFSYATWLRPDFLAAQERAYASSLASMPLAWDAGVHHFWASRECQVGLRGLARMAGEHDVEMVHPLNAPVFLAAMIARHGHGGPGSRDRATHDLVGDLLLAESTHRVGKAAFGGSFWTGAHREFADAWSGAGVDAEMVDSDRLRAEWRQPAGPHVGSMLLLHHCWLRDLEDRRRSLPIGG